jgi:ubiquinone/menaquinone biosynthesis C-methylase UbiE
MRMRYIEKLAMNSPLRTWLLRRLEAPRVLGGLRLPEGCSCLEIGCGRGAGALLIAAAFSCARIVCVDIDPDMIRRARGYLSRPPRWARGVRTDRIELLCGDAAALGLPDRAFDAAFLFGVLHHIVDWPGAVREIARVLRPGGAFCFEEVLLSDCPLYLGRYFRHVPFGAAELKAALAAAGLDIRRFETALFGRYCFVTAVKPPSLP